MDTEKLPRRERVLAESQEPLRESGEINRSFIEASHPWTDPYLALLYDAFPFEKDLGFYQDLAVASQGEILELGAGTGRVLTSLVAAGHRVTGLDASPHMLRRARTKLDALGSEARSRARLVRGDIRNFDLGRQFGLIVMPAKTFFYLMTSEDQRRALECVAAHLLPGGRFALDLLNPSIAWLSQPAGLLRHDLIAYVPDLQATVARTETVIETRESGQTRTILSIYDVVSDDGSTSRRFVEWRLRYAFRFEAQLLLEAAGLSVEATFGDYERGDFQDASQTMLFVARNP